MPQFDTSTFASNIFWLLICFSILIFYYKIFVFPKFHMLRSKRLEKIEKAIHQTQNLVDESERLLCDFNSALKQARLEADQKFEQACYVLEKQVEQETQELKANLQQKRFDFEEEQLAVLKNLDQKIMGEIHLLSEQIVATLEKKGVT